MTYIVLKVVLTAIIIVGISEMAKRLPIFAALLASLPLTSILAIAWLYRDTGDTQKVVDLSYGILLILPPSFVFFISLPIFLKRGVTFSLALLGSCVATAVAYGLYMKAVRSLGWL